MAILNQKKILNLVPKVSAPVTIHVSQGDVGTVIEFTLVKGDEVFSDTGNLSASVHGVREDGANFGPFTCTLSSSKVTFPLHSEMTAVKGSALAEIVLVDNGGNKVGSANFGILIEEAVFPLGVTYDNDVSIYESILAYVQTIPAQVTEDYNTKINAEIAARQAADTSLNEALASEASTRASADETINARIDNIIAPSGEAPSAAEVTDARVGADGQTYASLGASVRTQILNVQQEIDIVLARMKYKIREFSSNLSLINQRYPNTNSNIDKRAIYWATASTSNNERLMYYDENELVWKWLVWVYKSTIPNLLKDSEYSCKQYLQDLIFQQGYEFYNGTLAEINADVTVGTSKIYVSTDDSDIQASIMWYDGNHWCIAPYKLTELGCDESIDSFRKERDILLSRMFYGVRDFEGGVGLLNQRYEEYHQGIDKRALYVNSSEGASTNPFLGKRVMYYDDDANSFQYLNWVKENEIKNIKVYSNDLIYNTMESELIRKGYIIYKSGIITLRNDASANTNKIYVAAKTSSYPYRLMVYDGDRWIYSPCYLTDFSLNIASNFESDGSPKQYYIDKATQANYIKNTTRTSQISALELREGTKAVIGRHNSKYNRLKFAFITDTHKGGTRTRNYDSTHNISEYIAVANELCDFAIHGGDIITNYYNATYMPDMDAAKAALANAINDFSGVTVPFFYVKGNHDIGLNGFTAIQTPSSYTSGLYAYDDATGTYYYVDSEEEFNELVQEGATFYNAGYGVMSNQDYYNIMCTNLPQGVVEGETYGAYYYYDIENKLRIVIMNECYALSNSSYGINSEQISWIEDVLSDAVENNLAVMTISHSAYGGASIASQINGFIANGGVYIGHIHGHAHCDEYSNIHGFNNIGVNWGCIHNNDVLLHSGFVFDVFEIDLENSLIYEIREGIWNDFSGDLQTYRFEDRQFDIKNQVQLV